MKETLSNFRKYGTLALLPLLAGCGGGGLAALGIGGLFGGGLAGSTGPTGPFTPFIGASDANNLASISNPEPASLLLLSSGMAAMAYYKNKVK